MDQTSATYQTYVLRLWREMPHRTWRVTVRTIPHGEERSFTNLEGLFAYLNQVTGSGAAEQTGRFTPQPPDGEVR